LEPIFFDFDRYDLRPGDKEILDRNAQELRMNPKAKIRIEGNCDERGTVKYNRGLGTRRAEAARDYLVKLGIPADQFSVVSHGKEKPKYPGKTKEIYAKNRRVDFVIEFQ
jgi:peptidoglycan-associated lipoprotein